MGISFYTRPMAAQSRAGWYYEGETEKDRGNEEEASEELEVKMVKFNELMRDGVASRLNTILSRRNQEFTKEMLGNPEPEEKGILDIRA